MKKFVIIGGIAVVAIIIWQVTQKQPTSPSPENNSTPGSANTKSANSAPVAVENKSLSESGTFTINTEASTMRWEGKKPLIPNYTDKGTIRLKSGSVALEKGEIKSGSFVIDMNSIAAVSTGKNSGETGLTRHLMSDAFFDAAKFPTAEFKLSSAVKDAGDMMYQVAGSLTLKGITKPISFPAKIYQSGPQIKAEAKVALDRTEWDVRYGSDKFFDNLGDKLIDNMFTVEFVLVADKAV